jgi:hypothetical protein
MPALTRRRDRQSNREAWLIHHDDVCIGSIGLRSGVPATAEQWEWSCGFHPLPRQEHGTAPDFFKARAAFEAAWERLLPKVTQADLDEHRLALRWTDFDAEKKTLRIERAWEQTKKFGLRLKPP